MGKIILVLLFVCFGVVSPCEANPLDRATFLYRYWNASNAMWKHTQYIKGTHSYYITYKEYASTFSPSDFLRLASSKDDFFTFLSALRTFLEANDSDNAQRVIDVYNALFPNNLAERLLLERGLERYKFHIPQDVIFWKIPSDGKCLYKQLDAECSLYYTETISREITAEGILEDVCRVTLRYKNKDDDAAILSFYPSRKETLFVFVKDDRKEAVVLLRRSVDRKARADTLEGTENTVFSWFLYTFNLRSTPYIPLVDSCGKKFDGYYGVHRFLKRIEWDTSLGVELYFEDLLPSKDAKENFVWKTVKGHLSEHP